MPDSVRQPAHYQGAVQPIQLIDAMDLGWYEGSIVEYVARHRVKNGAEDLRKAAFLLERLIAKTEGAQHEPPIPYEGSSLTPPPPVSSITLLGIPVLQSAYVPRGVFELRKFHADWPSGREWEPLGKIVMDSGAAIGESTINESAVKLVGYARERGREPSHWALHEKTLEALEKYLKSLGGEDQ